MGYINTNVPINPPILFIYLLFTLLIIYWHISLPCDGASLIQFFKFE